MRSARHLLPAAAALLTIGCTTSADTFAEHHPAEGVRTVDVALDSGALHYQGARVSEFLVEGSSWGQATNLERATERQAGNSWSVALREDTLWLGSVSDTNMAGVDFDVTGPAAVNTVITINSGEASLSDVVGFARITAGSIAIRNLQGEADLLAHSGDIDASIVPLPGGSVRLEAWSGSVDLTLPWGGSYDLQVWGDPEYSMWIDDLGFGWTTAAPGYFAGISGSGATRIDVYVTGGSVRVHSAW